MALFNMPYMLSDYQDFLRMTSKTGSARFVPNRSKLIKRKRFKKRSLR